MVDPCRRHFHAVPTFDPEQGTTVVEPLQPGAGHWCGACSVLNDADAFYLYYRIRRPRDQQPDRGYECRIARSEDGLRFETIWSLQKGALNSTSMERACLVRTPAGRYRLYLSYVDPDDQRWRIDQMEADAPDRFDAATRTPSLTAADGACEGVKDPWVFLLGDTWHMILSYARPPDQSGEDQRRKMHATSDVYNTGIATSATALATSADGLSWAWQGDVFSPTQSGWDRYCRRINGLVWAPPLWIGFYDGAASVEQNYEERTGLAVSTDLRSFASASPRAPSLGAASGPGGVRYVEPVVTRKGWRFYYEYTREDGSHELRVSCVASAG